MRGPQKELSPREQELERAYELGRIIQAIRRCLLLYPAPTTDPVLQDCADRLTGVWRSANLPVMRCADCGAEWDGRGEPPRDRFGCDHAEMRNFWAELRECGIVRGDAETADDFLERADLAIHHSG